MACRRFSARPEVGIGVMAGFDYSQSMESAREKERGELVAGALQGGE